MAHETAASYDYFLCSKIREAALLYKQFSGSMVNLIAPRHLHAFDASVCLIKKVEVHSRWKTTPPGLHQRVKSFRGRIPSWLGVSHTHVLPERNKPMLNN